MGRALARDSVRVELLAREEMNEIAVLNRVEWIRREIRHGWRKEGQLGKGVLCKFQEVGSKRGDSAEQSHFEQSRIKNMRGSVE